MSAENVEIVRRSFEALSRGDLEAALASIDPTIEWHQPQSIPDVQVYRGHDGVRELLATINDSFDDLRIDPEEFIDAGDKVFVAFRQSGRGKTSGAEVDAVLYQVATLERGRITSVHQFLERADALRASGATS